MEWRLVGSGRERRVYCVGRVRPKLEDRREHEERGTATGLARQARPVLDSVADVGSEQSPLRGSVDRVPCRSDGFAPLCPGHALVMRVGGFSWLAAPTWPPGPLIL